MELYKKILLLTFFILLTGSALFVASAKAYFPPNIVYKTKGNYNNLVAVSLSKDGSRINGYPSPWDINQEKINKGQLAHHEQLDKGYMLVRNGMLKSAFLDITYEEYSKLPEIPSQAFLLSKAKYTDPFLEIYDCGYKNYNFNQLINNGSLSKICTPLINQQKNLKFPQYQKF